MQLLWPAVCSFWPVRHFAWGTAAAMNTEYSDLPMLRDLLFNVGLDHVKRETNASYSKFCKGQPGVICIVPREVCCCGGGQHFTPSVASKRCSQHPWPANAQPQLVWRT